MFIACELRVGTSPSWIDITKIVSKGIFAQRTCPSNGLAVHHGLAKRLLDKCRDCDLSEDSRQPPTDTRETGEDGAEASGYFCFYQTRGRGGHYRTR